MKRNMLAKAALGALALCLGFSHAQAEDWPKRPINLVVPYKAGGGTDAYARAISAAAKRHISRPVVVVNKPGSGGLNGAQSVLRARANGYTMMLTSAGSFLLSTLLKDTPIDALESFEFVAQVGHLRTALMVPANSPYQSAQALIEAMKAQPGKLRWAHSGRGGFHHVAGVGFLAKSALKAQDVPFKGGGPTRAALIGEQADFGFLGVQQLSGFEGKIRALGVNSQSRDAVMTEVPAFAELGVPFAAVSSPVIVFAPKGTPEAIVEAMQNALKAITADPQFAELLAKRGTGPAFKSAVEAKAALTSMKADAAPLLSNF